VITISAVCSYDTLTLEAIDNQLYTLRQDHIKADYLFFSERGRCDLNMIAYPYDTYLGLHKGMRVAVLPTLPDHMFLIGSTSDNNRLGLGHRRKIRIEDYREQSRAYDEFASQRDWEAIAEASRNAKNKRSMWCISELLKSLEERNEHRAE